MMTRIQPEKSDINALARCYECFEDGEDVDIKMPAINRLVSLGWLTTPNQNKLWWQITDEGYGVLKKETP